MGYATKFRLPSCLSVTEIIQQLTYDLDLFIYELPVYYNKPIEYLNSGNV